MNWMAALYGVLWLDRLFLVRHHLRAPRFYGPEWCFDCHVTPGFYDREGRGLMRRLQLRLLAPLAAEAAAGAVLWWNHQPIAALVVEAVAVVMGYLYNTMVLRRFSAQAWQYAVPEPEAVRSVVTSLRPRRAGDYTAPWLAWLFRAAVLAGLVMLGGALARGDGSRWRMLLMPGVGLYGCVGLSLLKRGLVAWRVFGLPGVSPEMFAEVQDATRRHLVMACDLVMGLFLSLVVSWSALQAFPNLWSRRVEVLVYPMAAVLVIGVPLLVRSERRLVARAKTLRTPLARWRPTPGRAREGNFLLSGRVCWEMEEAAMFVYGPRGLALNAGSARTRQWLAYLAGWAVLGVVLASRQQ